MGSVAEPGAGREFIESLRELIRFNCDCRDGLKHAAEHALAPPLSRLFRELAEERSAQAGELQAFVARSGGDARAPGRASAALHQLWLELRSALAGGDPRAALAQVRRGEEHLSAAYERALRDHPGGDVAEMLRRHVEALGAARARVDRMEDSLES